MTEIEYERWKDFAVRMARKAIRRRPKLQKSVLDAIKDFFDTLESDYFNVNELVPVAWDEEWKMDFNAHHHSFEFLRNRVKSWDRL